MEPYLDPKNYLSKNLHKEIETSKNPTTFRILDSGFEVHSRPQDQRIRLLKTLIDTESQTVLGTVMVDTITKHDSSLHSRI